MWKGIRPRRSPRSRSVGPRRCEAACVGGLARLAERETIHHVLPIAQGMVHEFVRAQISHGFQSPPYPKHADAMENVAKFLKPYSTPPKAKHTGMRSAWDEGAKGTARPGAFGAGCSWRPSPASARRRTNVSRETSWRFRATRSISKWQKGIEFGIARADRKGKRKPLCA